MKCTLAWGSSSSQNCRKFHYLLMEKGNNSLSSVRHCSPRVLCKLVSRSSLSQLLLAAGHCCKQFSVSSVLQLFSNRDEALFTEIAACTWQKEKKFQMIVSFVIMFTFYAFATLLALKGWTRYQWLPPWIADSRREI